MIQIFFNYFEARLSFWWTSFMESQTPAIENKDLISHYPNISRELDTCRNVL